MTAPFVPLVCVYDKHPHDGICVPVHRVIHTASTGRAATMGSSTQAVGTSDPQGGRWTLGDGPVMAGGCSPRPSDAGSPSDQSKEPFGMSDATPPTQPALPGMVGSRPASRRHALDEIAECRRILAAMRQREGTA